ncbi:MAG TPA: TolC family protein [Candidatus Binatia bacterium]|nr:TolC family protein [Candidatus Binatia bacterium]
MSPYRTVTIATAALATAAQLARADDARPLRLADVVAEAREHNPQLAAARARAQAAAAVPPRVRAYDDPEISWEAWNAPDTFAVGQADNNIIKLSQRVPFPGKRTLAGTVAEREADMAARDADGAALDVVTAVKRAYWGLWLAHATVALDTRDKELAARYAKIAEDKYAVGTVAQSDVLRAQVELVHMANRLITDRLAVDTARAELNALLSRPADDPLGAPEEPPPPRLEATADALVVRALRERPEVKAQEAAVAREEAGVRLAGLDYLPDFEFAVERFVNHEGRDGVGGVAALTIPLAYKGKYDAARSEARARLAAAQAELRRTQDQVRREVQEAWLRVRAARVTHDLLASTHVPQAEQAAKASEIGYETGKVDFLSLIDSLRALQEIHLEHVRASADFENAYADLERAVGSDLPRSGGE